MHVKTPKAVVRVKMREEVECIMFANALEMRGKTREAKGPKMLSVRVRDIHNKRSEAQTATLATKTSGIP